MFYIYGLSVEQASTSTPTSTPTSTSVQVDFAGTSDWIYNTASSLVVSAESGSSPNALFAVAPDFGALYFRSDVTNAEFSATMLGTSQSPIYSLGSSSAQSSISYIDPLVGGIQSFGSYLDISAVSYSNIAGYFDNSSGLIHSDQVPLEFAGTLSVIRSDQSFADFMGTEITSISGLYESSAARSANVTAYTSELGSLFGSAQISPEFAGSISASRSDQSATEWRSVLVGDRNAAFDLSSAISYKDANVPFSFLLSSTAGAVTPSDFSWSAVSGILPAVDWRSAPTAAVIGGSEFQLWLAQDKTWPLEEEASIAESFQGPFDWSALQAVSYLSPVDYNALGGFTLDSGGNADWLAPVARYDVGQLSASASSATDTPATATWSFSMVQSSLAPAEAITTSTLSFALPAAFSQTAYGVTGALTEWGGPAATTADAIVPLDWLSIRATDGTAPAFWATAFAGALTSYVDLSQTLTPVNSSLNVSYLTTARGDATLPLAADSWLTGSSIGRSEAGTTALSTIPIPLSQTASVFATANNPEEWTRSTVAITVDGSVPVEWRVPLSSAMTAAYSSERVSRADALGSYELTQSLLTEVKTPEESSQLTTLTVAEAGFPLEVMAVLSTMLPVPHDHAGRASRVRMAKGTALTPVYSPWNTGPAFPVNRRPSRKGASASPRGDGYS